MPCYQFELRFAEWAARRDRGLTALTLVKIPIQWNDQTRWYARAFYTAESLGLREEMHVAFYEEIHDAGRPLDKESALVAFFERFGVDRTTFSQAFRSQALDARLNRAGALASDLEVTGVPSIVIAGQYVTSGAMAKSYDHLIDIVDRLVKCNETSDRNPAAGNVGNC
jgi:thiol:disulfide interchange protein DsbA